MKHYAVIKRINKTFTPSVERMFDNISDAKAFAEICNRQNDGWEYFVFEICE